MPVADRHVHERTFALLLVDVDAAQKGDERAGVHHRLHELDRVRSVGRLKGQAGFVERRHHEAVDGHALVAQHDRIFETVGEAGGRTQRQGMARHHHRAEPRMIGGRGGEPRRPRQVIGHAEVGLARQHRLHDVLGEQAAHRDLDARMRLPEGREHRRHQAACEPVHRCDRDIARPCALEVLHPQSEPLVVLQGRPHMGDQQLPDRREAQAFGEPVKDLRAEIVLELQDLPVDGGGGDVEMLRGRADRPAARHFIEIAKRAGVQHRLSQIVVS